MYTFIPGHESLIENIFGKDLEYIGMKVSDDPAKEPIIFCLKSTKRRDICPCCGQPSTQIVNRTKRKIQDLPHRGKSTYLQVDLPVFACMNPDCKQNSFNAQIGIAERGSRFTNDLKYYIYLLSLGTSESELSRLLRKSGIYMSRTRIGQLIKEYSPSDLGTGEYIGIDEIAKRKGHTYETIIYDLPTGNILHHYSGRSSENLKQWLENHPNVKVVARDGSVSYRTGITEADVDILQVSDRFHLIQLMHKHLKELFYANIPKGLTIYIKDGQIYSKSPVKKPKNRKNLNECNYDCEPAVDSDGNIIELEVEPYRNEESLRPTPTILERIENIHKVKECWENLPEGKRSIKTLANQLSMNYGTIRNYLNTSEEEVENLLTSVERREREKEKQIRPWLNIVYKMLRDGWNNQSIIKYVSSHPHFFSSIHRLKHHISSLRSKYFPKDEIIGVKGDLDKDLITFSSKQILKAIGTAQEEKLSAEFIEYYDLIKEAWPYIGDLRDMFLSFYNMVMGYDSSQLDNFLEKYTEFVPSLCRTLRNDYDGIKNAIETLYSSGLVEGNNNKIKVLKRIAYGRLGIDKLVLKFNLSHEIVQEEKERMEELRHDKLKKKTQKALIVVLKKILLLKKDPNGEDPK